MKDAEPGGWALDHQLHIFAQSQSRPGPLTAEGERWMDRQQTGKVMVVCACGHTSGLIDIAQLHDTVAALTTEHTGTAAPHRTSASSSQAAADWTAGYVAGHAEGRQRG